jgi:hypothetical protein
MDQQDGMDVNPKFTQTLDTLQKEIADLEEK